MHGVGFELPLKKWFDFKVPPTSLPPTYIERSISEVPPAETRPNALAVWLGGVPELTIFEEKKGKQRVEVAELEFYSRKNHWALTTSVPLAEWLLETFAHPDLRDA